MAAFRTITVIMLYAAAQLTAVGCASSKETALIAFFKNQRDFPSYTAKELEERWERVVDKHHAIQKGMSVERVVEILGLPDTDFAKHGKTAWVRPEEGVLQYSAGAAATPSNTAILKVFHVYFDGEGKVSKVAKNSGFVFAPPPR